MSNDIAEILQTARMVGRGCKRRRLGAITKGSSESECWIDTIFPLMFPHLEYEWTYDKECNLEVWGWWPTTDDPLALVLPTSMLGALLQPKRYGASSRPDPRLPLRLADGKFTFTLENGEICTLTDEFFEYNPGLLEDLGDNLNEYMVPEGWPELWRGMVGSAWAYKAASVEPPEPGPY